MTTDSILPDWWNSLIKQYQQGVGRVFVLHDNVNDVVFYPSQDPSDLYRARPHPFRDMLIYLLASQENVHRKNGQEKLPFPFIFYASPTIPLTLYFLSYDDDLGAHIPKHVYVDQKKLQKQIDKVHTIQQDQQDQQDKVGEFIDNFPVSISSSARSVTETTMVNLLFEMDPYLEQIDIDWFPMVLILDFFEKITTQREHSANYVTEEIMRRWALSDKLKRSKNIVLGLTVDLHALPDLLRKSDSQIQKLRIPMPGPEDRYRFLSYWRAPIGHEIPLTVEIDNLDSGESTSDTQEQATDETQEHHINELAGLTKGFRLLNLETMVRLAKVDGHEGRIDQALFKKQKAQVINEESFELLEEIPAKRNFDAVGGLEYAKAYFQKIAHSIPRAQIEPDLKRSIPKGILLVGPPGTGKTILAEALAAQGKMTLVRLGDIRGSYIGQSEQNMSRTLKLLEELSPVVVFVDEIDQSIGRRSTGHEGDSGVNRRLFGKLLEFMGDNAYRGKVLWIGASNRPDMLDEAMISRFDTVMAILPPYALEERKRIIEVMEENVNVELTRDIHDELDDFAQKLKGYSGRAIETIIRKASDLAGKKQIGKDDLDQAISLYKSNIDIKEIDAQTIHALIATNFTDMMPSDLDHYPDHLKQYVQEALAKNSNLPLKRCLQDLQEGIIYT